MYVAGVEFTSTNGDSVIITGDSTAATIATSVTTYFSVGGGRTTSTTETNWQLTSRDVYVMNNLTANNIQSLNSTMTCTLEIATATPGNNTITIPLNTAGTVSDTTHTDTMTATTNIDYKVVTSADSTEPQPTFIEIWANIGGAGAAAVVYPLFFTTTTSLANFANAPPMFAT